ncbi:uncharacterized protein LOC135697200 [Ochlerotatus camptorhynchus]|uniref:uncharacterized protein LOC135697200 n=1 Tax=Ochlerotatus camptorhynchus TaxID=644619 RepID=UPI0031D3B714
MPYSNGATLRFLLPIPFRSNYQDCNLTRLSQSSDSVYHDEAYDVVGSIIPLAYRPMSAINGCAAASEICDCGCGNDDDQDRGRGNGVRNE